MLDICRKHSIQWAEQQGSCQFIDNEEIRMLK